ncbi:UNVERIFIED_CONTAM: hypothetical protein Scaly_2216700 [Sesamum calycinum]|uniref:Uncharacterized protein n=1 Tax=Sesamum calycinum TaxID=2727403 RepID=A0AAW2M9H8_9LAMI
MVVHGDFNKILYQHEKQVGNERIQGEIEAFRQCLLDCDLQELGFSGERFTWCNHREFPAKRTGFYARRPNFILKRFGFGLRSVRRWLSKDGQQWACLIQGEFENLCNVVYKIACKVIANRLKPFLGVIIVESQSTFVPSRLITDNVLVAHELNHYLVLRILRAHIADKGAIAVYPGHSPIARGSVWTENEFSKSAIVFSKKTPFPMRMELVTRLGVPMVDKHDKYLDFPARGKQEGGLEVRSLKEFNLALLCKQVWRIVVATDSPLHQLFKSRASVEYWGWKVYQYYINPMDSEAFYIPTRPSTFQLIFPPRTLPASATIDMLLNPEGLWDEFRVC